jgi:cobalt-zinc-cadmium efflux system protein
LNRLLTGGACASRFSAACASFGVLNLATLSDHHVHQDDHDHDHRHHGSGATHVHGATDNSKRLAAAALLTGLFMLVEIGGGLMSGSLALLADAGHMFTDFAALVLAYIAFRVAARPASRQWTYGFGRVSILAAFFNGLALFVIAALIIYEAILRLMSPPEILGGLMLGVAMAGLAVNLACFFILHGGDRKSLNMRGAALHVMGDLLGSIAAIIAAGVIMTTGFMPIDPLLSILVAVLILRSATMLVRESGHILLESAPPELDRTELALHLVGAVPGLLDIHHVHVWSLSENRRMATFHARLATDAAPDAVLADIRARLKHDFAIDHVTVEIESAEAAGSEACVDCF